MHTEYANAKRHNSDKIKSLRSMLYDQPAVLQLVDISSKPSAILNKYRQVIYANSAFINLIQADNYNMLIGKRPGEIVNCVNAYEISGCGTTVACSSCGAVNSILYSLDEEDDNTSECEITTLGGEVLHLKVNTKPFDIGGNELVLFSFNDISRTKRVKALEDTFIHDIKNRAFCIYSMLDILSELDENEDPQYFMESAISHCSDMIEEINGFNSIKRAESGNIYLKNIKVELHELVQDVRRLVRGLEKKYTVATLIETPQEQIVLHTDVLMFKKVLANMLKNAIEASPAGEIIRIKFWKEDDKAFVSVNNPTVIPEEHKTTIFTPFFTTKNHGTGLGTYSMKLIMTGYLGGDVYFTSDTENGTTFTTELPLDIRG